MEIELKKQAEDFYVPQQANLTDAGYDLIVTSEPKIVGKAYDDRFYYSIDYIEYRTNIFIAPKGEFTLDGFQNYHTLIHPRSSVSKYNLVLANSIGLIDEAYRGELICRFKYIWQPEDFSLTPSNYLVGKMNAEKIYKKGDRCAQMVVAPTVFAQFKVVDVLDETVRGGNGFGSSGS